MENFWNKFWRYNDLYVQGDTLLSANVFENFRNMCLKIFKLNPAKFLSAPWLAWQGAFKKAKVKLYLLTYAHMLFMVENGLCHFIYRVTEEEYVTLLIDMLKLIINT